MSERDFAGRSTSQRKNWTSSTCSSGLTITDILNQLHEKYGLDALTLAGGCAMNSVANGKVTQRTPFKKVYIQSAAGDAGGAIGAAFSVWNDLNTNVPSPKIS